ncbi:hypothetical protein BS47DRAFT_1485075 [Hydnum rufescens UP504]|uniref:Uncharacterized protein n=1 Tax=Hydnum rufescens UP504 TaxID=1448309 RepID=A0A9P6AYS0_9AGAM|nr:hypothetical protein BS47DRAFT_1485075 [Hydnum rufescens UP504]
MSNGDLIFVPVGLHNGEAEFVLAFITIISLTIIVRPSFYILHFRRSHPSVQLGIILDVQPTIASVSIIGSALDHSSTGLHPYPPLYIGEAWIIGLLVPPTDSHLGLTSDTAFSPFVIAYVVHSGSGTLFTLFQDLIRSCPLYRSPTISITNDVQIDGLSTSADPLNFCSHIESCEFPYVSVIIDALLPYAFPIAGLMTWFGIAFQIRARSMTSMKVKDMISPSSHFLAHCRLYAAQYVTISTLVIYFEYPPSDLQ